MQRLPRLVIDRVAWRLPVTDSIASDLLNVLSTPWTDESALRLESILIADPLLTTWVALRVRSRYNVTFGSHSDLANWLSRDRLLAEMRWDDSGDAIPLPADKATLATWSRLSDTASER